MNFLVHCRSGTLCIWYCVHLILCVFDILYIWHIVHLVHCVFGTMRVWYIVGLIHGRPVRVCLLHCGSGTLLYLTVLQNRSGMSHVWCTLCVVYCMCGVLCVLCTTCMMYHVCVVYCVHGEIILYYLH